MTRANGVFIVIEGTDGSGKATQISLLRDDLVSRGYDVAVFDFPQYDEASSYFVKEYLNGKYGSSDEVGPYTASLFYALDRYNASTKIQQALDEGKVVLANRYTGSNMAHQGTKFSHQEERRGYYIWLDSLEFGLLKLPRPDMNVILRVPAETAYKMIGKKDKRSYIKKKRGIHEADLGHLQRSVAVYDELSRLFPNDFRLIDCVRGGKMLPIETIQQILREKIQPMLPEAKGKTPAMSITTKPENPYVEKRDDQSAITKAGMEYLEDIVTNTTGDVYAFTSKLSPTTVAAAMARLSRRGDDLRLTLLDEFVHAEQQDAKLLQRVITAYGDDSVQQLVGQHLVVENASNLLTKKLEWGRMAAYLEQSTRYISYDQKDAAGRYRYFIPEQLNEPITARYTEVMDSIFELYSEMVHRMTEHVRSNSKVPHAERDAAWKSATKAQACDAARGVLPVATKSTVGIFASGQALESLIMHLLSDELPEARTAGERILQEARKVLPEFLERADNPERGGATIAYRANTREAVKQLADELLHETYDDSAEPVTLAAVWPRNETDIVADMMYEHSNQPLTTLRRTVAGWSYDDKIRVFHAYMGERLNPRHRPGRALENIHYSWDIVCDYGVFRDLQRHRMVDDLAWQMLTPRYGYDVPELVDEAGLGELYERCFEISLELFSEMQAAGYGLEAQYATLLGHKMRWKVTYNAREAFHIHELRTAPQGHPGCRKLIQQMHDKVAEVHPILAAHMRFVDKGEDPELTRLASERYTQFKLDQLSAN